MNYDELGPGFGATCNFDVFARERCGRRVPWRVMACFFRVETGSGKTKLSNL